MFSRTLLRCCRTPRGVEYVRNRFTNKGTAFTLKERNHLQVDGHLPPAVETLEDQLDRHWEQFCLLKEPINRYQLLRNILSINVTLYYAFVLRHLSETLPIIYTPTVGEACKRYGNLYTNDYGLYVGVQNTGSVRQVIQNMRKKNIEVIVLTDGSRILGLGDLGVNGIGISIGKTSLYVAAGGIRPSRVLPVVLDVGTNNLELRNNPLYLGTRKPRCTDEQFYALLDEFMAEAKAAWPQAVIQFEDFSNNHCFDMLERYKDQYRCFNDDIQGTGAVVSAGYLSALKAAGVTDVSKTKIVFFGAGSAAAGVAQSIVDVISQAYNVPKDEIRKSVFMVDSKGLVASNRGDKLAPHKVAWARDDVPEDTVATLKTLEDVVRFVKPTALIGLGATGGVFSKEICTFMASYCQQPIIFPLSNPSSKAEVNPTNAYKWTDGKAIVASGSPFPATSVNGKECIPSQGNNLYIFPGVGLASVIAQPDCIPQDILVAAAECLSTLPTAHDRELGLLYPSLENIRRVSAEIAAACIFKMQQMGIATRPDLPDNIPDLIKLARKRMYEPEYKDESFYLNLKLQPNEPLVSTYDNDEEVGHSIQ